MSVCDEVRELTLVGGREDVHVVMTGARESSAPTHTLNPYRTNVENRVSS